MLLLTETYWPEIGGGERQAASLGAALTRRGHTVTILTRRSRPELAREELGGNLRVVRLSPAGRGRRRKWGLAATSLPALMRLRGEHDVVLVSGFRMLGIPALLARLCGGRPTILKADSIGEMSGEYFRAGLAESGLSLDRATVRAGLAMRNALLRTADAFVAISGAIDQELRGSGVEPERIHRIPNGVDISVFRPASTAERQAMRHSLGMPIDGRLVVYTGRLVSYKGLPTLLRAWRELPAQREAATLALVGEAGGDIRGCERELRAYAQDHGLSVRFAGPSSRVQDWLRAADLFVFPSEDEAFGLSLVEAMACGLAAVATRVGGLADFVVDGVNSAVVLPGDAQGLCQAISSLLQDRPLADQLGRAARELVVARFDEGAVARAYETVIMRVLGTTRVGRAA